MRDALARVCLVGLLCGCGPGPASAPPGGAESEFFPVPGHPELPFSEAVRVGPMLYLAGQVGTDSTGKLVPGGIAAETRQALENVRAVLERHNSSLNHVVKCTAMLADIGEWSAMNQVYVTFFRQHLPARSAFATNGLVLGARIELECIASTLGRSV